MISKLFPAEKDDTNQLQQFYRDNTYDTSKLLLQRLPILRCTTFSKAKRPEEALFEVAQLLKMISAQRLSDHTSWITIGRIFHRVSQGTLDGLEEWISCTPSHVDVCGSLWMTMKHTPYMAHESIHTLFHYVKEDAFETYQQHKQTRCKQMVLYIIKNKINNLKACHFSQVLYVLYKDEFIYNEQHGWYQWKDGTWNSCSKECITLRSNIIDQLLPFFQMEHRNLYDEISLLKNLVRDIEEKDIITEEDMETIANHHREIKIIDTKRTTIITMCDKIEEMGFKKKIIAESVDLFLDTEGIIDEYVKSKEQVHVVEEHNKKDKNKDIVKSHLNLFVKYLITKDKDYTKQKCIELTSTIFEEKFEAFLMKQKIVYHYTISAIHIIRKLNELVITGITSKPYRNYTTTLFDKKEIKKYFKKLILE